MSFAFQALAVFMLALPGLILRYTYKKGFWTRPVSLRPVTEEVAYSLVLACCLHAVCGGLVHRFVRPVDLDAVATMIMGNFGDKEVQLDRAISSITRAPYAVLGYLVSLYAFAAGLGLGAHVVVRRWALDRRFRLLRFDAPWHYLLRGEVLQFVESDFERIDVDGTLVSVVQTAGGRSYLYVGVLVDYHFTPAAELDRLVLRGTYRRDLGSDRTGDEVGTWMDDRYDYVNADLVVLPYAELSNLAVHYLRVVEGADQPDAPVESLVAR